MATATFRGIQQGIGLYPREGVSVWIKQAWTDDWIYVPYLRPKKSTECALPTISSAQFVYDYGKFVSLWGIRYAVVNPLNISGWFVHILVHTAYGNYIAWIGKFSSENMKIEGVDWETEINAGEQTLNAVGLESYLDGKKVIGCWADGGDEPIFLPRSRDFNQKEGRGAQIKGNMSIVDDGTEHYLFGNQGIVWNNLNICSYIIERFGPDEPEFLISGQYETLAEIEAEYSFRGESVLSCLQNLISRKRGFGAKIVTDGIGYVYIHVFSIFAEPIYGAINIPANQNQIAITIGQDHHNSAELSIVGLNQYDEIIVEAQEPVKACFTMSLDSDTLQGGWTSTEESDFVTADETERGSDRFARVFRYFEIPLDWDWDGVQPTVDYNGFPITTGGRYWSYGKQFLRWLPFIGESPDGELEQEGQEYLEPFALMKLPATHAEFPEKYTFVERLNKFGLSSCNLRMSDVGLGVWITCSEGQDRLSLNHWPGEDTTGEPEVDWQELLITVNVDTEETVKVVMPVFPGSTRAASGRQAYIRVPGIECWFVANNTVCDIEDGELVYYNGGTPTFIRDDSEKLRAIAQLAWGWFGQQRATINLTIKNLLNFHQVGDLIMTAYSGMAYEQIGTVVTSVEKDYENYSQQIVTGYGEIDPAEFGE